MSFEPTVLQGRGTRVVQVAPAQMWAGVDSSRCYTRRMAKLRAQEAQVQRDGDHAVETDDDEVLQYCEAPPDSSEDEEEDRVR